MGTKQRILALIRKLKEEDKQRQEEKDLEEHERLEKLRLLRRQHVIAKEERTQEQDEQEYQSVRARWRVKDEEERQALADIKAQVEKAQIERSREETDEQTQLAQLTERRDAALKTRDARVQEKGATKVAQILAVIKDRTRVEEVQKEKNEKYLTLCHQNRQPIFKEQLGHSKTRQKTKEAEEAKLATYIETRVVHKKEKTKGKSVEKDPEKAAAAASKKKKSKKKKKEANSAEGD